MELIDLVNSAIIFQSQTTLFRWLTFLLTSQTVVLIVLLFWIYFFLLTLVFVIQWLSFHCEILIMLLSQFPLTFHNIHNRTPHFITLLITILLLIGTVYVILWEIFHGRISLNSAILLLLVNFLSRFRLELMYISLIKSIRYIPHQKYQVKPHPSPWFSAACAAAIVHRNHFFCLYWKGKSSESKVKFRQADNYCKWVLQAAKLAYANKRKESIISQKRGSHDFW